MKAKILKYELFLLFLLTVITLVVFYYKETLPDNYLSISSTANHGFFSYYFTSWFNFVNYYTGPWVLMACALFTGFYIFVYSSREDWIDILNVVTLSSFCVWTVYYLQPSLIGAGLHQWLTTGFSPVLSFFVWFTSLVLFSWGTFRGEFINKLQQTFNLFRSLDFSLLTQNVRNSGNRAVEFFQNKFGKSSLEKMALEEIVETKEKATDREKEISVAKMLANKIPTSSPSPLETPKIEESLPVIHEKKEEIKVVVKPEAIVEVESVEDEHLEIEEEGNEEYVDESQIGLSLKASPVIEKINEEKYYDIVKMAAEKSGDQHFEHPEDKYFLDIIDKIQSKLGQFKIEGRIINVLKGPVVDTFEWELGEGEKVSKLTGTAEDLTLALSGAPIRMVYPLKGRTTVGIEVPRNPREHISLDEVISSKDFLDTKHQLPLAMGKDAFGEPVVVDLAAMPHMLVAGSTGAGKSVYINSILVSLLVKKSPNQMKLILIDPKQLELALYAKLPHLLMPVVNDPKTAANSLLWACQEMERRYSIMAVFGVRNIEGFNHKLKKSDSTAIDNIRKFYDYTSDETYELPYIVIIVDEFADLMLSTKKVEIESQIARLAAKARAAGIHLILATQRPSVDVITGVIKSNFPTRVSFRVTTSNDSRTILNAVGAERLLGKGDMLYKHGVETTRLHSAYIKEDDIEALTDKLSEMAPSFNPVILEFLENGGEEEPEVAIVKREGEAGEKDNKYEEAVKIVLEYRTASASFLQRRLGVGYNRAANLIDDLEANGIIGPAQGAKPRKVLIGAENIVE